MVAFKNLNLSTEAKNAHAKVVAELERSALFALLGERLGKLPPDLDLPPANTIMDFGGPRPVEGKPPTDSAWSEMKEEFPEYCARYAILGMITAFEIYLQRLLFIARLCHEASQDNKMITGDTFHKIRKQCLKEVRNLSVDGVVIKISETINCDISSTSGIKWFRSVYGLRKCLLHRGGVVGEEDINDKGILTATWRKSVLSVNGKDITALPILVKKGGMLAISMVDEVRTWHTGEKLKLTAQDCQDIGMSLATFAGQITNELNKGLVALLSP